MKKLMLVLTLFVFLCGHVAAVETYPVGHTLAEETSAQTTAYPVSHTEQVEPLITGPELIELKANAIKWEHKYYTELLRAIALEYTGLCFKDKRWIDANQQIERINREIQQLIKRSKEE